MDSTELPKTAALVRLLDEIEMLLRELRCMESHVRQAQLLTAERIEKMQKQHQRELAMLQSGLLDRERAAEIQGIARRARSQANEFSDFKNVQSAAGMAAAADAPTGSSESESRLQAALTALEQRERENSALRCRLAELEALAQKARRVAQRDLEPKESSTRVFAKAEIAPGLNEVIDNEEHVAMKSDEHDPDDTGPATGGSPRETEQNLRDEIMRLRQEAQETNQILQDRNDELVRVKHQLDQLQERTAQLESSSPEESSAGSQADPMRTEFQAQLALLQAELSQKEWALEERQAEARSRELQLREQILELRKQLISIHREREQRESMFGEEGSDPAENDLASDGGEGESAHGAFAAQRRWHTGLGRKRRWRS